MTNTKTKAGVKIMNKPAYIIFVLAGTVFLITNDFSQAATFWGLALVFDRFDVTITFEKRPLYQKVWLFIHLAVTVAMFALMLFGR